MFTQDDINALIAHGTSDYAEMPSCFADAKATWRRLMCSHSHWQALAGSLDRVELAALIRGLVMLGSGPLRGAGSVSPVIPLYRVFRERFPAEEPSLTGWIVDHRTNPAEPFGTGRLNEARSYQEFTTAHALHDAATRRRQEEERQTAAQSRRIREAASGTTKLPDAVRRGDLRAVEALLAKGADVEVADLMAGMPLSELAAKEGHTEVLELLARRDLLIASRWPEMLARFAATVLVIDGVSGKLPVRAPLGETANRLEGLGLGPTFAVITPCNPLGITLEASANTTRLKAFRAELAQSGIRSLEADGWSADRTHVESGNACALDLDAAIALARKWGQLALFWFDGSQFSIVPCNP